MRVTWKQIAIFVLVLPLAIGTAVSMLTSSQCGSLICTRTSNRCDLDNGWLLHDRAQFPVEHLRGANVVWSSAGSMWTGPKAYGLEIVTLDGAYRLGGKSSERPEKVALKSNVDAFVNDPNVATLDVRVAADTVPYLLVAMLGLIYGFYGLALLVAGLRQMRERG
jgi:hypothetical protein